MSARPYTLVAADEASATADHGRDAAAAVHAATTTAAAITPPACTCPDRVTSDVAVVASVKSASVASHGQGGSAHSGFTARHSRNNGPSRAMNGPFASGVGCAASRSPRRAPAHACAACISRTSAMTTVKAVGSPGSPAVWIHHAPAASADTTAAAIETAGSAETALSTNRAPPPMASSSANAQRTSGPLRVNARNSSSRRLAINRTPRPAAGCSGRLTARATSGAAIDTTPNAAYIAIAVPSRSASMKIHDQTPCNATAKNAAMKYSPPRPPASARQVTSSTSGSSVAASGSGAWNAGSIRASAVGTKSTSGAADIALSPWLTNARLKAAATVPPDRKNTQNTAQNTSAGSAPACAYDPAIHSASTRSVAVAPAACRSSSPRAMATASNPPSMSSRKPNSSHGLAPYAGIAARYTPKRSGRAAAMSAVRSNSTPVSALSPPGGCRRPRTSAAKVATGNTRKIPIASGSGLSARNLNTHVH